MNLLTYFGFGSVSVMLLAYALEHRSRIWTLIFALGCISSAVYGFLADALPFAILECIWAVVAFKKWLRANDKD